MTIGYHDGHRRLQDEFESRKIADRLDEFIRARDAYARAHVDGPDRAKW